MAKEFTNFDNIFPKETADKLNSLLIKYIDLAVDDNIDVKNKVIQETEDTQGIVKGAIKKFYNSKEYQTALFKLVNNVNNTVSDRIDYTNENVAKITNKEVSKPIKIALDYHLSFLNEQGLNEKFNQPLRKLIYQRIGQGSSMKQLKESLKETLDANSFTKYSENLVREASSAYDSAINQTIVDKYKSRIKGFMMVGSIIETSEPSCKLFAELGRKLSLKTIEDKIIPLTDGHLTDPLDIVKIKNHFGCRHSFIGVLTDDDLV
jgi:hypothetical protein